MSAAKSLSVRTGLLSAASASDAVVSSERSTKESSGRRLNSATKLTAGHGSKRACVVEGQTWLPNFVASTTKFENRSSLRFSVSGLAAWLPEVFCTELKPAQRHSFVKII